MKTITCDKCKKEISLYDLRTVKCEEGYLFIRPTIEERPVNVCFSEVELCVKCKDGLGEVIRSWVYDSQ